MKKPSLAVLIGVGRSKGEPESDPEMSDDDQAYADAGDELKDALKRGDGKAVADAVCALFDLHMASREDDEAEGEESREGDRY